MNSTKQQAGGAPKVWLAIALFTAFVAVICTVSTSQSARAAAPVSGGINVPAPIPTEPVNTAVPTRGTPRPTSSTPQPTNTPGIPTPVPTGYPTVVPCYSFSDVQPSDWFYEPVNWMACNRVVGGYSDGTFRPYNSTTRAQTTKMLIGSFNLDVHTEDGPHFADVPDYSPFYAFVETGSFYGIIGGYPCGRPDEPCDEQPPPCVSCPYFRPDNIVTRSQITKISVLTAQQANPASWHLITPPVATFIDVPTDSAFFPYIETAVAHGIIGGYECGGEGEPCPGRYFHPQADATRAQISKISFLAALVP